MLIFVAHQQDHQGLIARFREGNINRAALGTGSIDGPRQAIRISLVALDSGLVKTLIASKVGEQPLHPFRF